MFEQAGITMSPAKADIFIASPTSFQDLLLNLPPVWPTTLPGAGP